MTKIAVIATKGRDYIESVNRSSVVNIASE